MKCKKKINFEKKPVLYLTDNCAIRQLQNERELGPICDRKACMHCLAVQTDQKMASSNINQLTEDDIPGAKIPRESLEHCRIWRMCPAKQSMHALRSQFGPSSRSFGKCELL